LKLFLFQFGFAVLRDDHIDLDSNVVLVLIFYAYNALIVMRLPVLRILSIVGVLALVGLLHVPVCKEHSTDVFI